MPEGVPLSAIKRICRECWKIVLWSEEDPKANIRHECEPSKEEG